MQQYNDDCIDIPFLHCGHITEVMRLYYGFFEARIQSVFLSRASSYERSAFQFDEVEFHACFGRGPVFFLCR
jgi:hypothetical protein